MAERNLEIIIKAQDFASKEIKKMQDEVKKLEGNFKKTGKAITGVSKNLKDMGPTFKKMAGFGTAALTGIGLGIKTLVGQASDLEETTQKFGVVYRDLGDEAKKTAKELASGFGLSQKASKQFLADLGDVTSGFGLSQEASLKYSKDVISLGVDLASFSNVAGGSEVAIDKLNKGLLGEHENLKSLGIIINETMLKKQLLADGTSELNGLELEQAKINARMTIALSQSKNAIGDFARSKESLANQTKILNAKMDDLTTSLGQAFLPVITKIVTALVPIIEKFAKWAEENPKLTQTIALAVIGITALIAIVGTLGLVLPAIITGVSALGTAFMFLAANPIGLTIVAIGALIAAGVLLVKNWEDVKLNLGGAIFFMLEDVKEKFGQMKEFVVQIGSDMKWGFIGWINSMVDDMRVTMDATMDYIRAKVAQAKALMSSISSTVSNSFKNVGANIKTVIGLDGTRATGGPVQTGKTFLVGERGPELFTPQSSGNITPNDKLSGGTTFNINMGSVNVSNENDADMLANKIRQVLINDSRLFNTGIS